MEQIRPLPLKSSTPGLQKHVIIDAQGGVFSFSTPSGFSKADDFDDQGGPA
jgi:hypothetical protein